MVTFSLWVGSVCRRYWQIRQLQSDCLRWEAEQNWPKLLITAQAWRRFEPQRREALLAGATAARALRQTGALADFLNALPRTSSDVPLLSMLADLQFGPLAQPTQGAQTCLEILRVEPQAVEVRQKLIFYYAVTAQINELLQSVREAARLGNDLPEYYVYVFLGDGLRLRNALDRLQQWMSRRGRDELLMVAYALHKAHDLEGGIPPVDEERSAALRKAQEQRGVFLSELRKMFPENHQLRAYDLAQAVNTGTAETVAEVLSHARREADEDFRFWRARGWLFSQVHEHEIAKAAFDEALRLNALDWRTRHYLADWARRTGDLSFAEVQQCLATEGKSLEASLLALPDVRSIPQPLWRRLAAFADSCGDTLIARRIRVHSAAAEEAQSKARLPNVVTPSRQE